MPVLTRCPRCSAEVQEGATACPTCGTRFDPLADATRAGEAAVPPTTGWMPRSGERLGRYVLERLIGSGGMSQVWSARYESLERPVAIKILHGHLAGDAELVKRFRREAEAMRQLDHPAIVPVIDQGEHEGRPFLVMAMVGSGNLRQELESAPKRRLDPAQVIALARTVLSALAHAHGRGLVHRDLKPENLIRCDGSWRLADFGIAMLTHGHDGRTLTHLTRTDIVMGTVAYMAPEQAEGASRATARSDLYSLGVVLYEALIGHRPQGRFEDPSAVLGKTEGAAWDALLLPMLERDPHRRPADALTCLRWLEAVKPEVEPAGSTARGRAAGGIRVDADGIRVGTGISIGKDGIRVGDGIRIDRDGVRIGSLVVDAQGIRSGAPARPVEKAAAMAPTAAPVPGWVRRRPRPINWHSSGAFLYVLILIIAGMLMLVRPPLGAVVLTALISGGCVYAVIRNTRPARRISIRLRHLQHHLTRPAATPRPDRGTGRHASRRTDLDFPHGRRLLRPVDGGMLGGVAAGLAAWLGIHPSWIRLGMILIVIWSGGLALVAYLIAVVLIPTCSQTYRPRPLNHDLPSRPDGLFLGVCALMADRSGLPRLVWRLLFVLTLPIGSWVVYLVLGILLPATPPRTEMIPVSPPVAEESPRTRATAAFWLGLGLSVLVLLALGRGILRDEVSGWVQLIVAFLAFLAAIGVGARHEPTRQSGFGGGLIVGTGIIWVTVLGALIRHPPDAIGRILAAPSMPTDLVLVCLMTIGLGLFIALLRHRYAAITFALTALVGLTLATAVIQEYHRDFHSSFGQYGTLAIAATIWLLTAIPIRMLALPCRWILGRADGFSLPRLLLGFGVLGCISLAGAFVWFNQPKEHATAVISLPIEAPVLPSVPVVPIHPPRPKVDYEHGGLLEQ